MNPKDRKEVKCPKCGNGWNEWGFAFEQKDIKWVPNGHKFLMGYKVVEGHDPYPLKVTCKKCGKVFRVEYFEKEKVKFT